MFGLGTPELIAIFVLILLLFGGKKIPELMRGVGRGVGELQKGLDEGKKTFQKSLEETKNADEDPKPAGRTVSRNDTEDPAPTTQA